MPFREVEIDLPGKELQGAPDIAVHRIGMLKIALDVDHRTEILLDGRLVVEVELVERERLFQLARGDQVFGIKFHDAPVLRVADGKRRGQRIELGVIFAVETHVGGEDPETLDLRVERHLVRLEKPLRNVQHRPVIVAAVVEIGQRHECPHVGGVYLQRPVVFGLCQRILAQDAVEVGQYDVVFGLVRHRFDHGLGLFDGLVHLARRDQQLPLHGAQYRDAPEAHLGRVERGDGREGLLRLLVEGGQNPVVVGVLRLVAAQAAVDGQRLVVTAGIDECLPEELVVPLVGGVEPEGRACQIHRLVGRGIHAVGGHFVIGRCEGRVVADGLDEEFPRPDGVTGNGILFDAFRIQPYAAQRIGIAGHAGGAFPGGECRKEEHAEYRDRCQTFHGPGGFRVPCRTGGGNARRSRNRGAGLSRRI